MEIFHTHKDELNLAILPFVMEELVELVMKKKSLPLNDALYYIYSSNLYSLLLKENTKLWYSSTLLLYEDLKKEKRKEKFTQNNDKKILLFKMFCIENFRESRKMKAEKVLQLFSDYRIFDFLERNFEMLHTQDTNYILDTIETYISKKK